MKKVYMYKFTVVALLATAIGAYGQSKNVGIGTTAPDKSAVLDIQSSTKGLLIPRMMLNERNQINNPADGLLIYQTNENQGFYFYNGTDWAQLSPKEAKSVAGTDGDWTLTGNAAAVGQFIGTTNNRPLEFKVNNVTSGRIEPSTGYAASTYYGYQAGQNNTGANNVGIGILALYNGTGANNMALGSRTLRLNTSGANNVAIGIDALSKNTTGGANLAIGGNSLKLNETGNSNVGIGYGALTESVGSDNAAFGAFAGNKTTGSGNTFVGKEAGFTNVAGSNNTLIGYKAGRNELGSGKLYISNSDTPTPLIYGDFSAKYVAIGDVSAAQRTQAKATGSYNLLVKGGILTEKVKVALATTGDWADYVFEPSYNLMSLESVESFVAENKHLPNVPSAEEMATNGLDVSQTSKMFMEKIEELTLYMIELNKEMKSLKAENEVLKSKLK